MQRFRLLCALLLVVSACSSAPAPEQANDLIFAGETPTPTIVAPADADTSRTNDDVATSNGNGDGAAPPRSLAFADWTVDDLVDELDAALDGPATVTFTGSGASDADGGETLLLDGQAWTTIGSDGGTDSFVTRGFGEEQWVTFDHVGAGILSAQSFNAATSSGDLDAATGSTTEVATLQAQASLAVLEETSELGAMWVPFQRTRTGFFAASVLTPDLATDIVTGAVRSVITADLDGTAEIESTNADYLTTLTNAEYTTINIAQDGTITLSSRVGWVVEIAPGIDSDVAIGPPSDRDVLSRELLLTATSAPTTCLADQIEASALVDDGLVVCSNLGQLQAIVAGNPLSGDEGEVE